MCRLLFTLAIFLTVFPVPRGFAEPLNISGVYPHLRMWNNEGECGTGAVVPWQGDLWVITYAPHQPGGSSDKLYQVTPDLAQIIFDGSVGGTPANRMIHQESNQLLIGPYLIDAEKKIRTIPPTAMFGRLTANARHLNKPESLIYYATMEEGLYEVDVNSLEVKCLIRDGNKGAPETGVVSQLPGYHGKGLYSGQGRLVYANNGERDSRVSKDPTIPSGALAQWFGEGDWQLVRRNQFTEVTGPGGISGNPNAGADPVWAMGWDARSLILALLEEGEWSYYRLPKGSHSYDGSHGWNTEWPRIREIGAGDELLATMHGTFWRFPKSFSRTRSAGLQPRSNYLKVVGDFCRWGDRIVLGCDDSAAAEFLNTRPFKAKHGAPKQSNSNLWFVSPERLDDLGPVIGRGSVWLREEVAPDTPSDPYLFASYDFRQLHLTHQSDEPVGFKVEIDREGTGEWETMDKIQVPAGEAVSRIFSADEKAAWIRLTADREATGVTANFQYRNRDERGEENGEIFEGIATPGQPAASAGVMQSLSFDRMGLVIAGDPEGKELSYFEIDEKLELKPMDDPGAAAALVENVRQPDRTVIVDEASVVLIEDGKRYRLPKDDRYLEPEPAKEIAKKGKTLADFMDRSLTAGAKVSAGSVHGGYAPENAVDGVLDDDEARWISSANGPGWLEINWSEDQSIASVWVVSGWKKEAPYIARDFDLQIPDGDDWKAIPGGAVRGNHSLETEIVLDEPFKTRRLRILSRDEGYFRLYEMAAFSEILDVDRPEFAGLGPARVCREVATERDLLNVHGTFYELPARNAQGLAKIRPIATHGLAIQDFCSHNGLLFFTGIDAETESDRIFRSADGKAAVWAGVIDDLWKLGKPRGRGGPWLQTPVKAGVPSDPYLMTAYDKKEFMIEVSEAATITLEVDVDGTGLWVPFSSFKMGTGESTESGFPEGFSAYWVRAISDSDTTATVLFLYQ